MKDDQERERKKKDKLRSAWISFVGRIVAQVVGAAATVTLGLILAGRIGEQRPSGASAAPAAPSRSVARPGDRRVSIAVLPLGNFSSDPKQEYFADGMTEALIADLAKIRALRVISRTSVMRYKEARKPLPEIARELGVDVVLEGSVVRSGTRVRVTAQLIHAQNDEHLWAESYDRELKDVLTLQADVARRIAREVKVALTPQEQERLARTGPIDPEAHSLYLKGRHEWNKRTAEGFRSAVTAFEQAIVKDAGYAPAYAGLADAWNYMAASTFAGVDPRDALPKAKQAAEKALALDESLGEAHASLGSVLYRYDWDFTRAEQELRRALELSPGYTLARQWLSMLHAALGRRDEAVAEARRALDLDPHSVPRRRNLAVVLYFAGRLEEAEREERRALAADPGGGFREFLAEVLLARRRPKDALAELAAAFGPDPAGDGPRALWGVAQAAAGEREKARAVLEQLVAESRRRYLPPRSLVMLQVQLGERDDAFRTLERALDERSDLAHLVKVHPLLAGLRADPRFDALLRRVGLPRA